MLWMGLNGQQIIGLMHTQVQMNSLLWLEAPTLIFRTVDLLKSKINHFTFIHSFYQIHFIFLFFLIFIRYDLARPIHRVDATKPASDIVCETAAAMAGNFICIYLFVPHLHCKKKKINY